jgi:DNA invertase Pin-like site-specific DNA recombinase
MTSLLSRPAGLPPYGDRPPQIQARHLESLAVVYVRQSSQKQVRENPGSTYAQQDLAELPRRWGWPDSRIRVIVDDLGLSATTTDGRVGLRDLLDWMTRGEVSLVIVREVARLSREPLDSETFLRTAIRAGVLIEANGKVYDTATADLAELFGLRIQALLAWYENAQRVQIFQSAKVAKVRRGLA